MILNDFVDSKSFGAVLSESLEKDVLRFIHHLSVEAQIFVFCAQSRLQRCFEGSVLILLDLQAASKQLS
jgi:hypothetical protein